MAGTGLDGVSARPDDRELLSFVPPFRRRLLAAGSDDALRGEARAAAILYVDMVGFTATTDRLAALGAAGTEDMAALVNRYAGAVIEIAGMHGGEVSMIAGDAVWAVWFVTPGLSARQAVISAALAARAVQRQAAAAPEAQRLRASIALGQVDHLELGSAGAWHGILTGPAVAAIAVIDRLAGAGDVVLDPGAAAHVAASARLAPLEGGAAKLVALADSPAPLAAGAAPAPGLPAEQLRPLLPAMLRARFDRGLPIGAYAEFRTVSVLFARFASTGAERFQSAVAAMQDICARHDGALYQVVADEKGASIIAVFGLPPQMHEDDAARAVRAGLAAELRLHGLGLQPSLGAATGRIFCCVYGGDRHRQFAIVGPAINLASRLAEARQGLLCDAATLEAARERFSIAAHSLPPLNLKGKAGPVAAFAPYSVPIRTALRGSETALAGREREMAALSTAITDLKGGQGGFFTLAGEPGIGKSALAAYAAAEAGSLGLTVATGAADEVEMSTPYHAWQGILRDLLGLPRHADSLEGWPGAAEMTAEETALLAAPLGLAPSGGIGPGGEARAERAHALLAAALGHVTAAAGPALVVLEDAHWLDSSSWALLERLVEARLPLLVIVTTRPLDQPSPPAQRLREARRAMSLDLAGLDRDACAGVLARMLHADHADDDIAELVHQRTGGNPFFVREMARVLGETGIVAVTGGRAGIATSAALAGAALDEALRSRGLPSTLEGVVLARLDRLPVDQQTLLRAASVIGPTFDEATLAALQGGAGIAAADMRQLAERGFITPLDDAGDYAFLHAVLRDVTYHATSFAERRRLHQAIADRLDRSERGRAGIIDALLAHHFGEAGDAPRAIFYFGRAGTKALHAYANLEAATLLGKAIDLLDHQPVDAGDPRPALYRLALARAEMRLSRYAGTRRHGEEGLTRLGFPASSRPAAVIRGIICGLGRQAQLRLLSPDVAPADDRARLGEACQSLEDLVETYFFMGDGLPAIAAALRTLNLAERLGPSPELARGYATVAGIASLVPLNRIAESYRRLSLRTLDKLDDPAATVWVSVVVALSLLGIGAWDRADTLLRQAATVAETIGDRRRWRDAVENMAGIAACRGDWPAAISGVTTMQMSAARDKDQRCLVSAWRERGFYFAHSGDWPEVAASVYRLRLELERGLQAEEQATRQDMLALAATLALQDGDSDGAARLALQALDIMAAMKGPNFPFNYWSAFLVARVFLNLWQSAPAAPAGADAAGHILRREARVHAIAAPAMLLCAGATEALRGHRSRARRLLQRSRQRAGALGMPYEADAAMAELALLDRHIPGKGAAPGLPLFMPGVTAVAA